MTSNNTPSIHNQPTPQKLNQEQVDSEKKSNRKITDSKVSTLAFPSIHQKKQFASIGANDHGLIRIASKKTNDVIESDKLAKKTNDVIESDLEISPETHRKHAHEVGIAMAALIKENVADNRK